MILIDQDKCIGCGRCITVCPFTVLQLNDKGKAENGGKRCIACMHCAAVCPCDAVSRDCGPTVAGPVKPLPEGCAAAVKQLIYQRRSYRRFEKRKIPEELVREALKAGTMAPSAKNEHPVSWRILMDEKKKQDIMEDILRCCREKQMAVELIGEYENGNNPVMGENAVLLIALCREDAINPQQDTAIALTTAELLLQAQGIGTCWGGYLTRFLNLLPECRRLLEIPEGYLVYGTLMAGYPDNQCYRHIPFREQADIRFIE